MKFSALIITVNKTVHFPSSFCISKLTILGLNFERNIVCWKLKILKFKIKIKICKIQGEVLINGSVFRW